MTQRQVFKTLKQYAGFELREYAPCVIATVNVSGDLSTAGSLAFRPLFQYISKGNNKSEKISMTSPVILAHPTDEPISNHWLVSFVMPAGTTVAQLPDPTDPNVTLRHLATELCIATSFRGSLSEDLVKEKDLTLRALASKENITLSSETRICRFDPPIKPGFLQYHELVIPLQ